MKRWLVPLIGLFLTFCVLVPAQQVVRRPIVASAADPLLTSLVASWKLSDLTDSAGANTLTNNNAATFNTGKIGNAVYTVVVSTQYLSSASNAALQMGDIDFTIGMWVYIDANFSPQVALAKRGDAAGSHEYVIYTTGTDNDNRFHASVFTATDTGREVVANNFGALSAGTWYCVVMWHDATANTVNVSVDDGTADSAGTTGALQAAGTAEFDIGRQAITAGPVYWGGRIDNVNIWKRVLTAGERTRFYNTGTGCEHPFSACP